MEPVAIAALVWIALPIPIFIMWLIMRKRAKAAAKAVGEKERELKDKRKELAAFREKFAPIISLEQEIKRLQAEAHQERMRCLGPTFWRSI